MLQQTQVATVLPYYRNWLKRFPNFRTLARASENEVLHAWQGLGYYARARNLHRTAKRVIDRHRATFPFSIEQMRALPGIGKYTAHAIASFAFGQSAPIIEANTARVLSRIFNLRTAIDSTTGRNRLWQHAARLVPQKSSSVYNSALLDLGALICPARKPKCGLCPVKKFCRAKNAELLPIKRPRRRTEPLLEHHAFVQRDGKLLLAKASERWRGMWILPALNENGRANGATYESVFPFTHHRVTLRVFQRPNRKIDNQTERWFALRKLNSIPIPSPHRRAIEHLFGAA